MTIFNITRQTLLADKVRVADTFLARLKGLLGEKMLNPGQALIIQPADSIHTWFMRFPIDVIFVDRQDKILKVKPGLPPFRFCLSPPRASKVIELPAGIIQTTRSQRGDSLRIG